MGQTVVELYPSSSPDSPPVGIQLDPTEADDLVDRFRNYTQLQVLLDETLRETVFFLTQRIVGRCSSVLLSFFSSNHLLVHNFQRRHIGCKLVLRSPLNQIN